jgi:DNA-binding NarL/FixJ family response regulator
VLFVSSSRYLSYAMRTVTFLLVDDTAFYRHILRQLVQSQPGWSVMAEADDGLKGIQLAATLVPDVVLMDVSMPIMNGIEATHRIKQRLPRIRIIVFSGHPDEEFRRESLLAGADYYLLKEDLDANTMVQLIATLFP